MSNYLETIKATIKELDPKQYSQMKASGELGQDLDEYRERVSQVASRAASLARKQAQKDRLNEIETAQQMNMAAMSAQEIEMRDIMEELNNLYGTKSVDEIVESMTDALNRNVLAGKLTP